MLKISKYNLTNKIEMNQMKNEKKINKLTVIIFILCILQCLLIIAKITLLISLLYTANKVFSQYL